MKRRACTIFGAALGLLTAQASSAQTLADQIVFCGGHGLAMGVLADIMAENGDPADRMEELTSRGNLLYDGLEHFYAMQTQCTVSFDQATSNFAESGSLLLERVDPVNATAAEREQMSRQFMGTWAACMEFFSLDFIAALNELRFSEPNPCGWRE